MNDVRLVADHHASNGAKEVVRSGIDLHNVAATGLSEYYPVAFFLKDANDEILGGLLGDIWAKWLQISYLWVAEPLRGQGWGTRLLRAAEEHARQRGCVGADLNTYTFQAPAFYPKHGYQLYATLEYSPRDHAKHFFRKEL